MNLKNSIAKFRGRFAGALSALCVTSLVLAQPAQPRQFGIGAPRTLEEMPASRFQTGLEKLPPAARENARKWLSSFHFTDGDLPSLHADANGGVCYACKFGHPHTIEEITAPEPDAPGVGAAAVPVSPFPESLKFHSRPGAPNVLFINFSGETVTGTEWNTEVGRDPISAVAFSADSDLTTFSDAEQAAIKRIWQRMAEDFSPFNINVTTERPATFNSRTAQALITRKTDVNGALNPYSTAGGVAYVNVFGRTDFVSRYSPAWVYHDNLSNSESLVAEAASHEIGHNLGLSHDGTSSSEYYGGHGSGEISWGPLMGTGYNRNVSQWSKGEYLNANNTQDDLTVIAGKISYRASDHGSTPGTATPLIITDGNKIVSTTPENDPSNATPANKGVLERTADVDVFSFVTGSGPVELTAKTWIQAAGTRGGNPDILLELYNEAGTLLASNNPDTLTSATISTTLAEGRYYLYVKNSGAGSPLSSSPSGYTSYGSLGQYFISGSITESTGFIVPPVAELQVTDVTASGQNTHQFTVTYSDNVAINVSTIGSSDIQVTGPGGYAQLAQLVSVSSNTNGTPRTATYSVTPQGGGTWSAAQNGTYIISMQSGEVADTEGAFVAAGELGQFNVAVPTAIYSANMDANPGWTLQPDWQYGVPNYSSGGPTSGFTGSNIIGYKLSGNYTNRLSMQYATTSSVNTAGTSSLTLSFRRWLGLRRNDTALIQASTDGQNWVNVWSTSTAISDSSWQLVQYPLPPGLAGSSSLRLRWGLSSGGNGNQGTAIGWNIDDVQLFGDGAIDSAPPEALLSVASLTVAGSPSHSCSVSFTDNSAVRLSSLDSTDLLVTGPNGYSQFAEFIGADLSGDGSPITGSYSIDAPNGTPSGTWTAADNGTYTVTLQQDAAEDTLGNLTAEAVLGTFDVVISNAIPGTLTLTPADDLNTTGSVGGPFTPDSITYTLSNNGETALNWTAAKTNAWVSLSASSGTLAAGASATVTVSINSAANSLAAGNYEDSVNFVNTTSGDGTTSRAVNLAIKTPGMLTVTPAGDLNATGSVGGPFTPDSITYTLSNIGETALDWTAAKTNAWVSLSASSGTLAAGASATVTVSINTTANSLATGNYEDSVNFVNTTSGDGTTSRAVDLAIKTPGMLTVTPAGDLNATGSVGGPFTPDSISYTLSNNGETALDWTAAKTNAWVSLSGSSGTLAAGASATVTVSINSAADNLAGGNYADIVNFVNTTDGNGSTSRSLVLEIKLALQFASVEKTAGGAFQMVILGPAGMPIVVEATVNLINWTSIATADIGENGSLTISDPDSIALPTRFYRVRPNP